jgi:cobalt/nickel transport system ATP-binding protein
MKKNISVITIKELSYDYPDQTPALRNINLTVDAGECLGIIGANGAGKSTLLLHLNGILRGQGQVIVDGLPVCGKNLKKIRAQVGLVFQDPNHQLFMPTLLDDMLFGPLNFGMSKDLALQRADQVFQTLGITHLRDKSPHHMSLGERKAASLATVLIMSPTIIVLDEPTVSLDPYSRSIFLQSINSIRATKIIASHDLDMVFQICNRVAVMSRGSLVAQGETEEILRNKELLESHKLEVPLSLRLAEAQRKG